MKNKSKDNKKQKKKENRILQTISAFASYLGCIGIALFVMYFLNGTVGILIAAALGCAFFISTAFTLIVMRFIKISVKLDKQSVSKGECLKFIITVSKKIIIPAPIILIHTHCSAGLSKETDICSLSLAGKEKNTVEISLTAKYSGAAEVSIQEVLICDYLGIFRFRLKKAISDSAMKLNVYPNIPDVPVQTDFLKAAVLASNDDDDDETNETANIQTGIPGYDHREYFPGDPIKRINWKMSSKRDIYYIRLDEKIAGSEQVFFLDSPELDENEHTLSVRDNIIEGMLAVFNMMVREGRDTTLYMAEGDSWLKAEIHNAADIYTLQEKLAGSKPCNSKDAVPPEIISSGKPPICFTAATDEQSESALRIVSECPNSLLICSSSSGLSKISNEMWILSDEFELKKQS